MIVLLATVGVARGEDLHMCRDREARPAVVDETERVLDLVGPLR